MLQKRTAWGLAVAAFVADAVFAVLALSLLGLSIVTESSECREAREQLLSGGIGGAAHDDLMQAYELACQQ